MSLGLAGSLPALVRAKYDAAKAAGSLIFSSTQLAVVRVRGIPFQLRYCPALSRKPTAQQDVDRQASSSLDKPDPFHNPTGPLVIAEIPADDPTHNLVLNKYPVIPQHFILATKAFKEQSHLLDEADFGMTYACLQHWQDLAEGEAEAKQLFAFFNSGDHSGASQRHRHIQFLPVKEMVDDPVGRQWRLLVDEMSSSSVELPFLCFHAAIPSSPTPSQLHHMYGALLEKSIRAVKLHNAHNPLDQIRLNDTTNGAAAISYNLALTLSSMVLCPRRKGSEYIRAIGSDLVEQHLGPVEFNGTILAGTLMVKNEDEWDHLRKAPSNLVGILRAVGISPEVEWSSL